MNILELLKNEKVEWKKISETCTITRGRVLSKEYLNEHIGNYPVYSSQTKNNGEIGRIDTFDYDGEYITWTTDGAYAGTVFYRNEKFSITNICGLLNSKTDKIINKFIFYWLQIEAKKHVKGGSGNPKLMSNIMADIKVPVPSVETQKKIVETLDKFTEYVTELQAELQYRTLQYNYYRDKLLSEEYLDKMSKVDLKHVEQVCLGELCEILDNQRIPISKEKRENGIYPYYGCNGIQDWVKDYIFDGTYLLIGEDGSVLNENNTPVLHYIENKKFWVNNHAHVIRSDNKKAYLKYIYYFLSQVNISGLVKGVPPKLNQANLKSIKIIVPALKVQKDIILILDKFQDILKDTEGLLPTEIEQRQKQYEYYREKLLTFDTEDKTIFTDRQTDINFTRYYEILKEAADIVGVELSCLCCRKSLDEIGEILGGVSGKNKSDFVDGNCKFITYKNVYSNPEVKLNENDRIRIHANEKQTKLKYGDIIFTGSSETLEESGMSSVVTENIEEDIYLNSFCFILRLVNQEILLPKYAKHLFRSSEIRKKICRTASGVTRYNVSTKLMKKIEILIPPLTIQEKIVEILENFEKITTSIQEGLPKEIELRQKQYEYYREKLLSFKR